MIAALLLGLAVGLILGVVGGGGSIVAVPALVFGVGMSTAQAVPTSLLVVGLSSLAALLPRLRSGVNWPLVGIVGIAGIPAAWAGAAVGKFLDPNILMLAFAVIMVLAGIRMLRPPKEADGPCGSGDGRSMRRCVPRALAVGVLVGFLTGLLGVGGGFLITPALTIFLGLSIKQAVGSSLAIIVINSAAGYAAHATDYAIDWPITLAFAAPAILGALLAARLSRRLNDTHIRLAFAVLIFAVALWVSVSTLLTWA